MQFKPSEIRFTNSRIDRLLRDGRSVNQVVEDFQIKTLSSADLARIRVFRHGEDRGIYTVDNQWLYIMRVLELRGLLGLVDVQWTHTLDSEETRPNVHSVEVVGDKTYPHESENLNQLSRNGSAFQIKLKPPKPAVDRVQPRSCVIDVTDDDVSLTSSEDGYNAVPSNSSGYWCSVL